MRDLFSAGGFGASVRCSVLACMEVHRSSHIHSSSFSQSGHFRHHPIIQKAADEQCPFFRDLYGPEAVCEGLWGSQELGIRLWRGTVLCRGFRLLDMPGKGHRPLACLPELDKPPPVTHLPAGVQRIDKTLPPGIFQSFRPAVLILCGTRDRGSWENLMPDDLKRS